MRHQTLFRSLNRIPRTGTSGPGQIGSPKVAVLDSLGSILSGGVLRRLFVAKTGQAPTGAWQPDYAHVEIILSGRLPMTYEGEAGPITRVFTAGDIFFAPPRAWNLRSFATTRRLYCIHFMPATLRFTHSRRGAADPIGQDPQQWHQSSHSLGPSGRLLLQALEAASREGRGKGLTLDMLRLLLRTALEEGLSDAGSRTGRPHETWLRVCDHLAECCHLPINRNTVARTFDLSPDHISRLFRSQGRSSFHEQLLQLRLERATSLLAEVDRPLSDVARACGFAEAGYFIKVFRRRFGVTPGQWRQNK